MKLTGKRAQRGNLRGGAPCWTYEVVWHGNHSNTWEPAACLIGWEKEMKKIDESCGLARLLPIINPAVEAQRAREAAAKQKAEELGKRKARLLRLKDRRARRAAAQGWEDDADYRESDDSEDDEDEEDGAELPDGALAEELAKLEQQLQMLTGAAVFAAAANAASAGEAAVDAGLTTADGKSQGDAVQHSRPGKSRVWKAFNRATGRCMLPHPEDPSRVCNAPPEKGTGTSGEIRHLERKHGDEWLHIKQFGERQTQQVIEDALAAKVDQSKPALGQEHSAELDRLVARWIAKCGRSQRITADTELGELLARILELCKVVSPACSLSPIALSMLSAHHPTPLCNRRHACAMSSQLRGRSTGISKSLGVKARPSHAIFLSDCLDPA